MASVRFLWRGARRFVLVGFALLVLGVVAGPARQASAHAELLATVPAAGAVLDTSPTEVVLTFNENVEISLGAIRLFDGTGTRVDIDEATHPGGVGSKVSAKLPSLKPGSYVVSWRAISADSHPVSAAFVFQIGTTATLGRDVVSTVEKSAATNTTAGFLLGVSRALVTVGLVLVGGLLAAFALAVCAPTARRRRLVLLGAVIGGVAGVLAVPFEAAYVSGRPLSSVLTDANAWRALIDTRVGTAWLVRAAAILVAGVALARTSASSRTIWWRGSVVAVLVAFGVSSAYGGHGATGRWVTIGTVLTVVHVVAFSVWLGGLIALVVDLGSVTRDGARRFSRAALICAAAVVASGVLQGWRQLGSVTSLFDNAYGRLLVAKAVGVILILGFATGSRRAVHGSLRPGRQPLAVGADGDLDRAGLQRSVGAELVVSAAVIVLSATLMGANPHALGALNPFTATLVSNDYLATLTIAPPAVGSDQLHIYLSSPGGSLTHPDSITVSISDAKRSIAPIGIPVVPAGANHFQANAAYFPYPSTWTVSIKAVYNTFDEIDFTTNVKIR